MKLSREFALLWLMFALAMGWSLNRLPGLLGDEGSEGQNAYEILHSHKTITIMGEHSYIGPLIDYVRIPFIQAFGYTTLALRLPIFLTCLASFWLAYQVFRKLTDEKTSLIILAALFFSPIYLLYQRLGWAVSLFPFFALLLLFILTSKPKSYTPLLAGLVAGLGLHNYITFFPTIMAISMPASFLGIRKHGWRKFIQRWWPAFIGFWAGFGTQFAVMQMYQEDQGRPWDVVEQAAQRLAEFPAIIPKIISGSVYAASYTGQLFPESLTWGITIIIGGLMLAAIALPAYHKLAWLWLAGLIIQVTGMLMMIDRFTLRYFVIFALGCWVLAGLGLAAAGRQKFTAWAVAAAGIMLVAATTWRPFLGNGGRIGNFSLDDPRSTAETTVDIWPLIDCLRGRGVVYADNIHIANRLQYLQHEYSDWRVTTDKKQARWLVRHRWPTGSQPGADEACPDLTNFRVRPYNTADTSKT